MAAPSSSSRRGHQRFPCRIEVAIYKSMLRPRIGAAEILDIGMGGARIVSAETLSVGESYQIKFANSDQKFSFDFRVAWKKQVDQKSGENFYGAVFLMGKRKEESLKSLIGALRQGRKHESGLDLKSYWNA